MLRTFLVAAMLAACGDDGSGPGDPHAIVECGASWDAEKASLAPRPLSCEFACEETPPNYMGSGTEMPCNANHPDVDPGGDFTYPCPRTFEVDGVRGCCIAEPISLEAARARLWTCVP